jgi:hypothetical protein
VITPSLLLLASVCAWAAGPREGAPESVPAVPTVVAPVAPQVALPAVNAGVSGVNTGVALPAASLAAPQGPGGGGQDARPGASAPAARAAAPELPASALAAPARAAAQPASYQHVPEHVDKSAARAAAPGREAFAGATRHGDAAAAAGSARTGALASHELGAIQFDGAGAHSIGAFEEGETLAQPTGWRHALKKAWDKYGMGALNNTLTPLYNDNSRKHYYHGLSLATLEKAVDSGGLAATLTYVSDEAGYPYGYARTSARKTGTPGVVLQFEPSKIETLIVPGHYNPRAPGPHEKWEDVPHWFMAEKTIPLSAQTELSKRTVLEYLAAQRDAHPSDKSWDARIAKFEKAFEAKAPAPRPKAEAPLDDSPAGKLGLSGLKRQGDGWVKDGRPLQRVARGTIGFIDIHPTRPGLIVKTISPHTDQFFNGLTIDVAVAADDKAAQALADAGVGPKVLGTATIDKRHVSVRERVFGKTMRQLIDEKSFGAEEEALVLDMARRMAKANTLVSDMTPQNIMIGVTERDGTRKAYFVDGGIVESFPPGLDEEARYDKILDYPNVIMMRMDYNTRQIEETVRPLRFFLKEGREESSMSRWQLFWKRLFAAFMQGGMVHANR